MADDLSSAVAERLARERGGDVGDTTPTTPAPVSQDDDAKPSTEHQTQETETESQTPEKESQAPEKESQTPNLPPESFETLTPEQIAELVKRNKAAQEIIHRQAQSMKDKELARIQREQEEARRREEEQRRLMEMDDEEYGRMIREQQHIEELVRQRATEAMIPVFYALQNKALNKVGDTQTRSQIEQQIATGDLADLEQILETIIDTEVAARTQKQLTKMEQKLRKEIREAIEKERAAEIADEDDVPPVLGSGIPTGSGELYGESLISAGVAELRRKAARKRT